MKKLIAVLLIVTMGALIGCGNGTSSSGDSKESSSTGTDAKKAEDEAADETVKKDVLIGVSMPTQSLQRWNQDGDNLKKFLTEMGFEVDLQYADNEVQQQVSQIENMITKGVELLIIAPVDGSSLSAVLSEAKAEGIYVIAHDRFLTDTKDVDIFGTFDNNRVGELQGEFIVDQLDLENEEDPFNLEIVSGSLDDNNAAYFLDGAMDILQPYIDSGKLVVQSGQTSREQTSTDAWQTDVAQARMDNILTAYYTEETLDVVLCSNDSTALGAISALKSAGYGSDDLLMPIITGQDCDTANVKAIVAGEQSMSVFKDTRALAKMIANMAKTFVEGGVPETNMTYDNGAKEIPAYALEPIVVTKENYNEKLIDSGYYSEDELQ